MFGSFLLNLGFLVRELLNGILNRAFVHELAGRGSVNVERTEFPDVFLSLLLLSTLGTLGLTTRPASSNLLPSFLFKLCFTLFLPFVFLREFFVLNLFVFGELLLLLHSREPFFIFFILFINTLLFRCLGSTEASGFAFLVPLL